MRSEATVYKITHRDTGRCFVGVTEVSVERAWTGYKSSGSGLIGSAISQHGPEAFDVEVLAVVPVRDGRDRRREEIVKHGSYFPGGFNRRSFGRNT